MLQIVWRWVCTRCGRLEETDQRESPRGWLTRISGSETQSQYDLCGECRSDWGEWLAAKGHGE